MNHFILTISKMILSLRLNKAGFTDIKEEVHAFSKYWVATKTVNNDR